MTFDAKDLFFHTNQDFFRCDHIFLSFASSFYQHWPHSTYALLSYWSDANDNEDEDSLECSGFECEHQLWEAQCTVRGTVHSKRHAQSWPSSPWSVMGSLPCPGLNLGPKTRCCCTTTLFLTFLLAIAPTLTHLPRSVGQLVSQLLLNLPANDFPQLLQIACSHVETPVSQCLPLKFLAIQRQGPASQQ